MAVCAGVAHYMVHILICPALSDQIGQKGRTMTVRVIRAMIPILGIAAFWVGLHTSVYNGANKGITVFSCGVEVIDQTGHFRPAAFCGDF